MLVLNRRVACWWSMLVFCLLLSGCLPPPTPGEAELPAWFDVSAVTCPEIPAARERVLSTYDTLLLEISDIYLEWIRKFEADLNACLEGIWKKGPCDDAWGELQKAYTEVSAQVSDDNLYNTYKAAKGKRDECYAQVKADDYQDWSTTNKNKEQQCRDDFQQAHDAAERLYYEKKNTAKAQRDAALAALDELQKECNKPKTGGDSAWWATNGVIGDGKTEEIDGEPPVQEITPDAPACQPTATVTAPGGGASIPGANTQPRTWKAPDKWQKDVLKELLQAVAEDVVGNPIPVSAISDQVFAVMVCAKLRTRLAELEMEQSDAQLWGQRSKEIRLRKKIADYNHASQVWCAIAEGRPPLDLKEDMQQIKDAEFIEEQTCTTAADCGEPACCSATEIGIRTCNDGVCASQKSLCPNNSQCAWTPAQCWQSIQVIAFQGKFIPIDQLHTFQGDECDVAEHWHANAGVATATDGTKVPDTDPCGYGKTASVPAQALMIPVQ
jgi:hypothetical protein